MLGGVREPGRVAAEPGSLKADHHQQLEVEIFQTQGFTLEPHTFFKWWNFTFALSAHPSIYCTYAEEKRLPAPEQKPWSPLVQTTIPQF